MTFVEVVAQYFLGMNICSGQNGSQSHDPGKEGQHPNSFSPSPTSALVACRAHCLSLSALSPIPELLEVFLEL